MKSSGFRNLVRRGAPWQTPRLKRRSESFPVWLLFQRLPAFGANVQPLIVIAPHSGSRCLIQSTEACTVEENTALPGSRSKQKYASDVPLITEKFWLADMCPC